MLVQEIIYHFGDISICSAIQCDQLESMMQIHLSAAVGHVTDPLARASSSKYQSNPTMLNIVCNDSKAFSSSSDRLSMNHSLFELVVKFCHIQPMFQSLRQTSSQRWQIGGATEGVPHLWQEDTGRHR